MAVNLYANSNDILYGIKKYVVDTEADLAQLPTNLKPGSMAFVIENSKCYMIGNTGVWAEVDAGASLNWVDFFN